MKESAQNLDKVLMKVTTVPMDNYSFDTIVLLKESLAQWEKDIQARKDCEDFMKKYCQGAALPGGDIPTTFKLPVESVDRLRTVGARLLSSPPEYQKLLKDLYATIHD